MEFDIIKKRFTEDDACMLNPLVLAFIGDAVYEVFVRTHLVDRHRNMAVHNLHVEAISFVKAEAQSNIMKKLEDELSEREMYIFKRGRNAKSGTVPKNANVVDYRIATGFEALVGYLYITEQHERLNEIMNKILAIK